MEWRFAVILSLISEVLFLHKTLARDSDAGGLTDTSLNYLEKYGYIKKLNPKTGELRTEEAFTSSLKTFQRFAGLRVTGRFDRDTRSKMEESRCGMNDTSALQFVGRKRRYLLQGSWWRKKKLTYRIVNYSAYTSRIHPSRIRGAIRKALSKWQTVSTLQFFETRSKSADILIRFVKGSHGDPYSFDGKGGTLAHAFYPMDNYGLSGDVHFDDDERFTLGTSDGTNLYWVALHEFGHSIGLEHSNVRDAVMFPWYKGFKGDDVNIHEDDIRGIRRLYGPLVRRTTSAPVTTRKVIPSPAKPIIPRNGACLRQIKAVFLERDNKTYVINKDKLYIIDKNLNVERGPINIGDYYPGLTKVDAVVRRNDGRIVFYYGYRFSVYEGRRLIHGPHFTIQNGFQKEMNNLDAGFEWITRGVRKHYFFKKDKYWRYDPARRKVDRGYPKKIADNWFGIPRDINAVFRWRNKALYFFKGSKFYRFDSRRLEVVKGYPRAISGDFIICPFKASSVSVFDELDLPSATVHIRPVFCHLMAILLVNILCMLVC